MSIYSDKLAYVLVVTNCQYFVAQMCTREEILARPLGVCCLWWPYESKYVSSALPSSLTWPTNWQNVSFPVSGCPSHLATTTRITTPWRHIRSTQILTTASCRKSTSRCVTDLNLRPSTWVSKFRARNNNKRFSATSHHLATTLRLRCEFVVGSSLERRRTSTIVDPYSTPKSREEFRSKKRIRSTTDRPRKSDQNLSE